MYIMCIYLFLYSHIDTPLKFDMDTQNKHISKELFFQSNVEKSGGRVYVYLN